MLTYEIHPILRDDTHYIDSQPFKVATTLHNCNEFIYFKHSKSSLYNYYNVNSQ